MKPVLAILGIGMIILGLIGIGTVAWLGWIDFGLGVLALIAAALLREDQRPSSIISEAFFGIAALALWIIGLVVGAAAWLVWWTFAFGVAFLLVAAAPAAPTTGPGPGPGPGE